MNQNDVASRGFTLIEMLAVTAIFALITTAAVVIFGRDSDKKSFHNAIEEFINHSNQVADLTILTGEPVGLVLTPPDWQDEGSEHLGWSYTWKRYIEAPPEAEEGETLGLTNDVDLEELSAAAQFFQNQIPDVGQWADIDGIQPVFPGADIDLYLELNGDNWDWDANPPDENPIFVLTPSGETEPVVISIQFRHENFDLEPQHIELNLSGRLEWLELIEIREELEDRF